MLTTISCAEARGWHTARCFSTIPQYAVGHHVSIGIAKLFQALQAPAQMSRLIISHSGKVSVKALQTTNHNPFNAHLE